MYSIDQNKKNTERNYIQALFEYLKINEGSIIETESPDFIISYDGQKVGIELVTICPSALLNMEKGSSLSIISKLYRKEAIKCYEQLLLSRKENFVMNVQFKSSAFWLSISKKKFVKQVVDEIELLRKRYSNSFWEGSEIISNEYDKTTFVESIQLIINDFVKPFVLFPSIEYIHKITQEDFEQCIKCKLNKLFTYKRLEKNIDIQEYWLAITINIDEPYEFWRVPYKIPENFGYERMFLIQYSKVRELKRPNLD